MFKNFSNFFSKFFEISFYEFFPSFQQKAHKELFAAEDEPPHPDDGKDTLAVLAHTLTREFDDVVTDAGDAQPEPATESHPAPPLIDIAILDKVNGQYLDQNRFVHVDVVTGDVIETLVITTETDEAPHPPQPLGADYEQIDTQPAGPSHVDEELVIPPTPEPKRKKLLPKPKNSNVNPTNRKLSKRKFVSAEEAMSQLMESDNETDDDEEETTTAEKVKKI